MRVMILHILDAIQYKYHTGSMDLSVVSGDLQHPQYQPLITYLTMSEKPIVTQQPQPMPTNFFLKPTADFQMREIWANVKTGVANIRNDSSGLSGTHGIPPREFETGLFTCFKDIPTCLCVVCCNSCLFHRTYQVLNRAPDQFPDSEYVGGTCVAFSISKLFGGCVPCTWITLRRGAIREKYNIIGSARRDAVLVCCCAPCVMAQDDIEVRKVERQRLEAYQTSQGRLAEMNM